LLQVDFIAEGFKKTCRLKVFKVRFQEINSLTDSWLCLMFPKVVKQMKRFCDPIVRACVLELDKLVGHLLSVVDELDELLHFILIVLHILLLLSFQIALIQPH
jgi:hypothetical protein